MENEEKKMEESEEAKENIFCGKGYNTLTPLEMVVLRNQTVKETKKQQRKRKNNYYQPSPYTKLKKSQCLKYNIGKSFTDILNSSFQETEGGLQMTVYDRCVMSCIEKVMESGDIKSFKDIIEFVDKCTADVIENEGKEDEPQSLDKIANNGGIKNVF